MQAKTNYTKLIPILLCFFAMGFVDLVGIATNYVKSDLSLTDTEANIFPSMVFFWFLILSVPTGMLMNKIGRKNTVLISLVVTLVGLIVPSIGSSYAAMLVTFSLLGIGNTLMQVSLNPLVSNIVSDKQLASSLTLGQFFKAIAAFIAPILAAWFALHFDNWKLLFPLFGVVGIVAVIALGFTRIHEKQESKNLSLVDTLKLLNNRFVLLAFLAIVCHVGIDVGMNVTAPKLLIDRLGLTLTDAGFATSLYFIFRTIGCFSGTFILAKVSNKGFFLVSIVMILLGMIGLFMVTTQTAFYICIALIGFGNSNLFPIIFSQALQNQPEKSNEVSGLMIMGIFGGTVFPFVMGVVSDAFSSQLGAVAIMCVGVAYLLVFSSQIRQNLK